MGEKDHRKAIKKHEKHKPGCIVRCVIPYEKGNTCSHRWQASKQARAEKRVPYSEAGGAKRGYVKCMDRLARLKKTGALWGGGKTFEDAKGRTVYKFLPYRVYWCPFKHNCHHIIPVSTLWGAIDIVAKSADPKQGEMLDAVVGALLVEKYNLNAQINMIVLPMTHKWSQILGLPQHTEGGRPDHPKYRAKMEIKVNSDFPGKFTDLRDEVKKSKHKLDPKSCNVKPVMHDISKSTYEAIISHGAKNKGKEQSLESGANAIAKLASKFASS